MNAYFRLHLSMLFFAGILIALACTKNPFGDDDISSEAQTIHGTVSLQRDTPEGVYVWLEGFNLGTFSDTSGAFELKLPSSSRFANLTGNFHLYFFVANYAIDTASVVIHNGEVKFALGDLDENGKLNRTIHLIKLMHIKLAAKESVFDDAIPLRDIGKVAMELTFTAIKEAVTAEFPRKTEGPLCIIFMQRISPDNDIQKMVLTNPLALESDLASDNITTDPRYWTGSFNKRTLELPIGAYKITPYCLIHQPGLPDALVKNFCRDKNNPTIDFVNLPMKIEGGIFETYN
ncbi:MAG: hypothetical protein ACOY90_20265 [Candidatus Zhuqueibacterota bacterium]